MQIEPGHDVFPVTGNGFKADLQLVCNLRVAQSFGQKCENLALTGSEFKKFSLFITFDLDTLNIITHQY